jgi:cell division septation protein DedD
VREFAPKRGYQYQAYEKPEPFYDEPATQAMPPLRGRASRRQEDPALAAVLSGAGPGMGFVKTVLMGALSILIVFGSFYTSFTLGKKIFMPSPAVTQRPETFDNAPLTNVPTAEELEIHPKTEVKTESQKHLTPIYEYDEAQRIKMQMGHIGQAPAKKPIRVARATPITKKNKVNGKKIVGKKTPVAPAAEALPKYRIASEMEPQLHRVVAGSFTRLESAKEEAEKLKSAGFQATVYRNADNLYRVQIGVYRDLQNAQGALDRAIQYGYPAYISQN